MKFFLPGILAVVMTLWLTACQAVPVAPGYYKELRNDHGWTLTMGGDARYFLNRNQPSPSTTDKDGIVSISVKWESEEGLWTVQNSTLLLKSDSGATRTFFIRQDPDGFYLVSDSKDFPVLRWVSESPYL